jgi:hypothetical protein
MDDSAAVMNRAVSLRVSVLHAGRPVEGGDPVFRLLLTALFAAAAALLFAGVVIFGATGPDPSSYGASVQVLVSAPSR